MSLDPHGTHRHTTDHTADMTAESSAEQNQEVELDKIKRVAPGCRACVAAKSVHTRNTA